MAISAVFWLASLAKAHPFDARPCHSASTCCTARNPSATTAGEPSLWTGPLLCQWHSEMWVPAAVENTGPSSLQGSRLPIHLPITSTESSRPQSTAPSGIHCTLKKHSKTMLQVGAFPFDHIDNPDPNSPAAHEEVYKQQTGEKWSEVPHIAKAVEKVPGRVTLYNYSNPRSIHTQPTCSSCPRTPVSCTASTLDSHALAPSPTATPSRLHAVDSHHMRSSCQRLLPRTAVPLASAGLMEAKRAPGLGCLHQNIEIALSCH